MASFRSRILGLVLGLVTFTAVATVAAVVVEARSAVRAQAEAGLQSGAELARQVLRFRAEQLRSAVRVMVADFGFKEALATGDAPTILSAIENHGKRIGADAVLVLGLDGQPVAGSPAAFFEHAGPAVTALLAAGPRPAERGHIRILGGRPYQLVMAPVLAPEPIAWVAIGFALDDRAAAQISRLVGVDVAFVGASLAGEHYRSASLPPAERGILDGLSVPSAGSSFEVEAASGTYLVSAGRLPATGGSVSILLLTSLARALEPYEELRWEVLAIGAVTLLAALALAAVLARGTMRPVEALTEAARRIESGDYSAAAPRVHVDEFDRLAATFNTMREAVAEREARIRHQAFHDALTGLPNRARAVEVLDRLLGPAGPAARKSPVAACVVDLQRFQDVNASLGHATGDQLLREVARRLDAAIGRPEHVARLSADQFLLILEGQDALEARRRFMALGDELRTGIELSGVALTIELRGGIAAYPQHATVATELLRRADIALIHAKDAQAHVAIYGAGDEEQHRYRLQVLADLRKAVDQDELHLHFQPKVEIRTGRLAGCEALLRWEHPARGAVPPGDFIPVAERTGTIRPLTSWVLDAAVVQLAEWRAGGLDFDVAVNLSAADLADPLLPDEVLGLLQRHAVPASSLVLEVTESTVMRDLTVALAAMERLRLRGIRFAIDDFGTGYSSLAQLKRLPVSELKIDRSFVIGLGAPGEDEVIVRSTIELGHALGLKVVAEGVETAAGAAALDKLGCDHAQGYHIARPMPAAELTQWALARAGRAGSRSA